MELEKITEFTFDRKKLDNLFSINRFKSLINTFQVDRWSPHCQYDVTNSVSLFSRWVSSFPNQARKRGTDDYDKCKYGDQFVRLFSFNHYLFDHVDAFKTTAGFHFVVSMPYTKPQYSISEFDKAKRFFHELKDIEMCILPHEYKYRKNGDYIILYYRKNSQVEDILEIKGLLSAIPDGADKWSES